jgi:hypothetical protein
MQRTLLRGGHVLSMDPRIGVPGTPPDAAANLGPLITYHLGC